MDNNLQALLRKLEKYGDSAVSIAVLSDNSDVSKRTVRRRLHQLIELCLITSQGKNRGVRYALTRVPSETYTSSVW